MKNARVKLVRICLLAIAVMFTSLAQAEPAGTVINVSGPLFVVKADGNKKVLSIGSTVEQGDMLLTEEKTYARVKFTDAGEVVIRPNTQFKVAAYSFKQSEPKNDNVALSLFKGALRSVTGAIGKRGNQDAYQLQTATATIGIRGTQFVAEYVPGGEATNGVAGGEEDVPTFAQLEEPLPLFALGETTVSDVPAGYFTQAPILLAQNTPGQGGGLAPGLYVHVIDGLIQLSNRGGVQQFAAGQFGFTGSVVQPPVIVPNNPGIQFNPPPAFSSSTAGNSNSGSKPKAVDCEVR